MSELQRLQFAEFAWAIEEYHRGLKQCCGVERAQVRSSCAQRNHIGLAIRACLRLKVHWFATSISWYEAKSATLAVSAKQHVRDAIRAYLAAPRFVLTPTAYQMGGCAIGMQFLIAWKNPLTNYLSILYVLRWTSDRHTTWYSYLEW